MFFCSPEFTARLSPSEHYFSARKYGPSSPESTRKTTIKIHHQLRSGEDLVLNITHSIHVILRRMHASFSGLFDLYFVLIGSLLFFLHCWSSVHFSASISGTNLAESSCFTLRLHQAKNISDSDGTNDVPDNRSARVIHEFNADLSDSSSGTRSAQHSHNSGKHNRAFA